MKKGISPVVATLLTMIVVLVFFFIFSGTFNAASLQEKSLIVKQSEAIGEIPCTRSPTVQFTNTTAGVYLINPKPVSSPSVIQFVTLPITAKISSSCLEDVAVTWIFGDGKQEDMNCTYVTGEGYVQLNTTGEVTNLDCSFMNHTYLIEQGGLWALKDIRLQVFGLRSAFYSEADTVGFVTDPNFKISFASAPDISDYSCVLLDVKSTNSKFIYSNFAEGGISELRIDAIDSKRLRSTDSVTYLSKDEAKFTYRAPLVTADRASKTSHTVQVLATHGYQTVENTTKYTYPGQQLPKKEILILSNSEDAKVLDIWQNSSQAKQWKCVGSTCSRQDFPFLKGTGLDYVAVAAGDVNLDGEDDIITLMTGDKNGEIFVFKNSDWERTTDFHDLGLDDLKDKWMHAEPAGSKWKDIAVGDNISFGGRIVDKGIIALSDTTLALYEARGGSISLVNEDTLPSHNSLGISSWVGLTTADVDNDDEDEVIALAKGSTLDERCNDASAYQVFIFKYGENQDIGDGTHRLDFCLIGKDWVGIIAGDFDGGTVKDDVLVLAKGGIEWYQNLDYSKRYADYFGITTGRHLEEDFPNVEWKDVTSADINRDGVDEILAVHEDNKEGEVCIFNWSALNALSDSDWVNIDNDLTKLKEKTNPTCMTIFKGATFGWTSIAAGDVGCFQ
jgi:hypothetical protein